MNRDHSTSNLSFSPSEPPSGSRTPQEEQETRGASSPSPAEMYEKYFVPGMFARWAPVLLEYAAPQAGERVLDLACGTGIVARTAAPMIEEEGAVVGLDQSPEMLAIARDLPAPDGAAIEWQQGDAGDMDLPDDAFDLVVCQQGLQFFPDQEAAVAEIHRVLAPGGRLALVVWQELDRQPVYKALCEAEARFLNTSVEAVAGPPFSMGNANALQALLEKGGFEQIEIQPESHTVRFPDPGRFVKLTTMASAAVLPEFSEMKDSERSSLVEAVSRELEPTLRTYTEDNEVAFSMHAHVAVARVAS